MSTAGVPFPPGSPLARLLAAPLRPGIVTWVGVRPARRLPIVPVATATLVAGDGLVGDHYASRRDGARQVTLIGAEDLAAIASFLGRDDVAPEMLRRNIVLRGINLSALGGRPFRLGSAVLEASGPCAPCSRMETSLGPGGYNAVRGHGGITARVVTGGVVHVGDAVTRLDA